MIKKPFYLLIVLNFISTFSFFYSYFNLQALINIAELGNKVGMKMWKHQSESKKSLLLAINYLTLVINGEKWKHNTLKKIDFTPFIPILVKA